MTSLDWENIIPTEYWIRPYTEVQQCPRDYSTITGRKYELFPFYWFVNELCLTFVFGIRECNGLLKM